MTLSFAALAPPCPCGSGLPYGACCGPVHDGECAVTAEALMRSRYAAYALGRLDHVLRSWHPRTRPARLDPDPTLTWRGLSVDACEQGGPDDATGTVTFRARFRDRRGEHELAETSRFERRAGRWVYVDGAPPVEP